MAWNLNKYDNKRIADNIIVTRNLKIPTRSSNNDSSIFINIMELILVNIEYYKNCY